MDTTPNRGVTRRTTLNSLPALVFCALALPLSRQARAHHAFSSEFDANRPVTLTGPLVRLDWVDPHAWLWIDVTQADGTVAHWGVEVATPNTLLRRGLRKPDLRPPVVLSITGFQAKDGGLRAHGVSVRLPDGRKVFLSTALANLGDDQR